MPKTLLQLIEDLYRGTSCQVRLKGSHSAPFRTHSGVRQGCVLAPTVFCRAIDWILRQALSNCGVNISSTTFTDTDYADDIAVLDSEEARLADTLARIDKKPSCCWDGRLMAPNQSIWRSSKVKFFLQILKGRYRLPNSVS